MDAKKPPDPDFEYDSVLTITLPEIHDSNAQIDYVDPDITSRKRVADSPPSNVLLNPPKLIKKEFGRQIYTQRDNPPYVVHVSLKDGQTPNTVLHPIKFGMFLKIAFLC